MINENAIGMKAINWKYSNEISDNVSYWLKEISKILPKFSIGSYNIASKLSENNQPEITDANSLKAISGSDLSPLENSFLFGACEIIDDEPMFV